LTWSSSESLCKCLNARGEIGKEVLGIILGPVSTKNSETIALPESLMTWKDREVKNIHLERTEVQIVLIDELDELTVSISLTSGFDMHRDKTMTDIVLSTLTIDDELGHFDYALVER
jgi:hypothetical protein